MVNFHSMMNCRMMLILVVVVCLPHLSFADQPKVTTWVSAGILRDFPGDPNPQNYRMSAPEIRQLDTNGGELLFRITPVSDPGCTQTFRAGWVFDRNVRTVREGESFSVQLYIDPAGDSGSGLRDCYTRAKARIYDGGLFRMDFMPSAASHFHQQPEYGKYHGGNAQYLFVRSTNASAVDLTTPNATSGFLVLDSPYVNSPGYIEAEHGSFTFRMSKGGLFVYEVTYLYDGVLGTPPGDPLGQQWLEKESGWQGVWIRRGTSNVFDARWGSITAVMTMTISGNQVTIERRNSSDGNNCNYTGTIAADGVTVNGTYLCNNFTDPRPWSATIQR